MQYAGVQALQQVSDEELGNDVAAWREFAASKSPTINASSIASQPGERSAY